MHKSLNYFFEFGPDRLNWGIGLWGENRELMDLFRKRMRSNPKGTLALIDDLDMPERGLMLGGSFFKRIDIPPEIPQRLRVWYAGRELYIFKEHADYQSAFSQCLVNEVRKDFLSLAPLYRMLRGYMDELS